MNRSLPRGPDGCAGELWGSGIGGLAARPHRASRRTRPESPNRRRGRTVARQPRQGSDRYQKSYQCHEKTVLDVIFLFCIAFPSSGFAQAGEPAGIVGAAPRPWFRIAFFCIGNRLR